MLRFRWLCEPCVTSEKSLPICRKARRNAVFSMCVLVCSCLLALCEAYGQAVHAMRHQIVVHVSVWRCGPHQVRAHVFKCHASVLHIGTHAAIFKCLLHRLDHRGLVSSL